MSNHDDFMSNHEDFTNCAFENLLKSGQHIFFRNSSKFFRTQRSCFTPGIEGFGLIRCIFVFNQFVIMTYTSWQTHRTKDSRSTNVDHSYISVHASSEEFCDIHACKIEARCAKYI